jgi:HSP20 family protein
MTNTALQPVATPQTEMNPTLPRESARVYTPRVDIVETDDELILYAELPGVRPGDVSLDHEDDQLILHARCGPRYYGQKAIHAEYGVGDFYRAFAVTEQVEWDGIEACLKDGVLAVRLPKAEAIRPRRITVKAG